jgi:hypothetical protein
MSTKPLRAALVALVLTVAPYRPVAAKAMQMRVGELIAQSELIVVGRVIEVSLVDPNPYAPDPYAVVDVQERWLGASSDVLLLSLRPTWSCDASRVVRGEEVVLFLSRNSLGQWHISHSGHGRMPIASGVATVSSMVLLPGEKGRTADRVVSVDDLHGMVASWLKRMSR